MGVLFLLVLAASVYLVYVLEILKFRSLDAMRLRRVRPETTEAEIDADVEKHLRDGRVRVRPARDRGLPGGLGGAAVGAVDGAQEDPRQRVDERLLAERLAEHELLVEGRARSSSTARTPSRARPRATAALPVALEVLDAPAGGVDEPVDDAMPRDRDLVVGRGRLHDRPEHRPVLAVERADVGERPPSSAAGSPSPENQMSPCAVELVGDVLRQAQQQLALVAEVEVERGARDPARASRCARCSARRRTRPRRAAHRRLEHRRLDRGALGRRCAVRLAPHHAIN